MRVDLNKLAGSGEAKTLGKSLGGNPGYGKSFEVSGNDKQEGIFRDKWAAFGPEKDPRIFNEAFQANGGDKDPNAAFADGSAFPRKAEMILEKPGAKPLY